VAALTGHDHTAAIVGDLLALWGDPACKVASRAAAAELLRELAKVGGFAIAAGAGGEEAVGAGAGASTAGATTATGAASKDTASLRRCSGFIIDASQRMPTLLFAHLSVLLPFLECESHTLRSAIVSCMANLIIEDARSPPPPAAEGEGGDSVATRQAQVDMLLSVMAARVHDTNSLTRAAVMKAWTSMVTAGVVPLPSFQAVTALAVGRLMDKGASVRKAAAALLRTLLECNPFGPRIDAALFEQQAALAEQWLVAHAPHLLPGHQAAMAAATAATATDSTETPAPAPAPAPVATEEEERYSRLRRACAAAAAFAGRMGEAVDRAAALMGSKVGSDVMEAIR